jgi:hypothetical protein
VDSTFGIDPMLLSSSRRIVRRGPSVPHDALTVETTLFVELEDCLAETFNDGDGVVLSAESQSRADSVKALLFRQASGVVRTTRYGEVTHSGPSDPPAGPRCSPLASS